jgi:hypothetical protein
VWLIALGGCGAAPADQQTFGADHVEATHAGGGWQVRITDGGGRLYVVDWTLDDAGARFTYRPPDGVPEGPIVLDGVPTEAAGFTRASYFIYKSALAADAVSAQSYTGITTAPNHAGCDEIGPFFSCAPKWLGSERKGGCCDAHDECITANCGGCGDDGNVMKCLWRPPPAAPCSAACLRCHVAAVVCFGDTTDYGDSNCCARGNCDHAQECMIDGVVITDPCECKSHNVASVSGCGPCVANGQPLTSSTVPCCSGNAEVGPNMTSYCVGSPGAPADQCNSAHDCTITSDHGIDCQGGRCCSVAGEPSPPNACFCCSGRSSGGVCL